VKTVEIAIAARGNTKLAAIRKGKKDVQAGRVVCHKKTARWVRSWGKKRELPPPSFEYSEPRPALEKHQ
jgi:predicted transcriptional regulator